MASYRVIVLSVVGILFAVDDLCTARIFKLNVPEASFKDKFFKNRENFEFGNFRSKSDNTPGDPFTEKDFITSRRFSAKDFAPERDPISKFNYFEGDIGTKFSEDKNSIVDNYSKWPGGVIPYVISKAFDERDRSLIAKAMQEFQKKTCIRFKPRSNEKDFVSIIRDRGCFSMIGRQGGDQVLKLDVDCMYVGIIMHELMHAVGFYHEQSREDRDDYVTIRWENIQDGQEYNFAKYSQETADHPKEEYDYDSLMHYDMYEFSKYPNQPTVVPKKAGAKIGNRKMFSPTDIRKINKYYQCDSSSKGVRQRSHGKFRNNQRNHDRPHKSS